MLKVAVLLLQPMVVVVEVVVVLRMVQVVALEAGHLVMEYQIQEDHLLKLHHLGQLVMVMRGANQGITVLIVVVVAVAPVPLEEVLKVQEFQEKAALVVLAENLQPSRLMEYLDFLLAAVVVAHIQLLPRQLVALGVREAVDQVLKAKEVR